MEEEDDSSEKTEEPSLQRLEEFRRKGMVASSRELISFFLLLSSLTTIFFSTVYSYEVIKEFFDFIFLLNSQTSFTKEAMEKIISQSLWVILKISGPVLLSTVFFSILIQVGQIGILFSPEVLNVDFSKVNPLKGIKRYFSMKIIVELIKTILKLILVGSVSYFFLKKIALDNITIFSLELEEIPSFITQNFMKFFYTLLSIYSLIVVFDFAWEKYSYHQKLLLSKKQAKEEYKEKEGNPEIKQRIRSIQHAILNKKMMKQVKESDVIISNPTHISIALKYNKESMLAPLVVAKGADFMALRIREIARDHKVPIVENIPLARSLYKHVKVNKAVPRSLYKAVAEVLAFVYKLKKKEKAL